MFKLTDRITENVINRINAIKDQKGLTPESFLEDAEKTESPLRALYPESIWDNSHAAHLYRLQYTRSIINEIKIIVEDTEYYAFENVKVNIESALSSSEQISKASTQNNEYKPERRYELMTDILNDDDMRKQIVEEALKQIKTWKAKYSIYKEFEKIIKAIEELE